MSDVVDRPGTAPLAFTGGTLDRADLIRVDAEKLAATWADPRALIVLLDGLDPVLGEDGMLATMPVPGEAALIDHALLGLRPGPGRRCSSRC